jgi:glycosyltransferase involved in cell wall biosynthesis
LLKKRVSKKSHVVFITSGHSPFSSRLFHKELKSLKKVYDRVTIIAPYDKPRETIENVRIIGIKKYKSRYNRWSSLSALYRKASEADPDIIHCHEPDSLFVAYLLKRKYPTIKAIYDCHEFHPESFTENFPPFIRCFAKILIEGFENFLITKINAVITVNQILAKRFEKYNPSVIVLPNYPVLDISSNIRGERELISSDEIRLIYVGTLSEDRGLTRMFEMLTMLPPSVNLRLVLIGKFSSSIEERQFGESLKKYGFGRRVEYMGYLPHEKVIMHLRDADIGLFLVNERERYKWAEPIKYFEYSLSGLPIVISDLPATRALIENNKNGILVIPDSALDAANAVKYLFENPVRAKEIGERGRKAVLERYNWEFIEPRLFDLYDTLTRKNR